MEENKGKNVGEETDAEMSADSSNVSETVGAKDENKSVDGGADVSGTSSAPEISKDTEMGKVSSDSSVKNYMPQPPVPSNAPVVSSSTEDAPKVTFKVPDLSKVIRKPKNVSAPQSVDDAATGQETAKSDTDKSEPQSTVSAKPGSSKERVSSSKSRLDHLSPAEKLKQLETPLAYREPPWGGPCEDKYNFEVLKNGSIIDNVDLTAKSFHVFGRLPSCDVTLEHPSLSRHHAILQYCDKTNEQYSLGWYLYDLDSTHGTWINKNKVRPNVYYRIKVGYVIKFGGSSRLFIMQGPDEDADEESELSVTELKEQRQKQKEEMELREKHAQEMKELENAQEEQEAQDRGCSWGMFDGDVAEEGPDSENPFALPDLQNEDLYIDDPKKALKGYYEREGLEVPEYKFEEVSFGQHKCTIELPIDDSNTGMPIIVEVQVSGKKREAVVQCALEACKTLDRYGELRKANQESRKKKSKNWEEQDYYDSDDDTYLDRTGEIERKRQQRMKKAGKLQEKAETYDSLVEKLTEVQNQVKSLEERIAKAKKAESECETDGLDALDAFMTSIKSGAMDTKTRMKLKIELLDLRKEQQRLERLVNVARPATLPPIQRSIANSGSAFPMVGKVRALNRNKLKGPTLPPTKPTVDLKKQEEEESDEEEEEEKKKQKPEVKKIKLFSVEKDAEKSEGASADVSVDSTTSNERVSADLTAPLAKDSKSAEKLSRNGNEAASRRTEEDAPLPSSSSHLKSKDEPMESEVSTTSEVTSTDASHKKENSARRKRAPQMKSTGEMVKKLKQEAFSKEYSADDPDYSVWVPPADQSGDGKTSLNEKYGY